MSCDSKSDAKTIETLAKLETANGALGVKIAANKARMRTLVGKLAGVAAGDVVTHKGARYRVAAVVSESAPKKGKPVLSGYKIAKNGNVAKRPVEIAGGWVIEGSAPAAAPAKRGRKPKAASLLAVVKRRPGRPRKSLETTETLGTA